MCVCVCARACVCWINMLENVLFVPTQARQCHGSPKLFKEPLREPRSTKYCSLRFCGTSLTHVWIQNTITFLLGLSVCSCVNESLCTKLLLAGDANPQAGWGGGWGGDWVSIWQAKDTCRCRDTLKRLTPFTLTLKH